MNRRGFLKSIVKAAGVKVLAPLAPLAIAFPIQCQDFVEEVKRLIPIYGERLSMKFPKPGTHPVEIDYDYWYMGVDTADGIGTDRAMIIRKNTLDNSTELVNHTHMH